jgi:hypothetical protein
VHGTFSQWKCRVGQLVLYNIITRGTLELLFVEGILILCHKLLILIVKFLTAKAFLEIAFSPPFKLAVKCFVS